VPALKLSDKLLQMKSLQNKRILLGVTGSIAAYKSADLIRRLREQGAEVRVVMTRAAMAFITPLTLQTLSGSPVRSDLLDSQDESTMGHIELARWADVVLVAPASADTLARLAQGRSNDLLSALCLVAEVPLLLAPAMNQSMWAHAATQSNVSLLQQRGAQLLGPVSGEQACGELGEGRFMEPADLLRYLSGQFVSGSLGGQRVIVTAGPTREAIDPVRYVCNRSSGKMGFAVARAAAEAGAKVLLVSGPVSLEQPDAVECIRVESAEQMKDVVLERVQDCDIFISAAAVADYRPAHQAKDKIKKTADQMTIQLERTTDILASVSQLANSPFTVGFAAETQSLHEYAQRKLVDKQLDMVAANDVSDGQGFDQDDNALELIWANGQLSLPLSSKDKLARKLIEVIAEQYNAKGAVKDSGSTLRH